MGKKSKARRRGVGATALAFVLIAGVYLAERLLAESTWWSATLLYLPQPIYLVPPVLATLVCLGRRRPWLAYLNLGLALAVLPALMGLKWSTPAEGNGPRLRVMTYNIQLGSQGLDGIVAEIEVQKPDVICMQEAYSFRGLNIEGELRRRLPRYRVVARGDMLTASRLPIKAVQMWPLPGASERRPVLVTGIEFEGRLVTVANAHLIPGHVDQLLTHPTELMRHVDLVAHARPAEVDEILDRLAGVKGPAVVAGDFNNQPNGECYAMMSAKMTDAFASAGRGFGYTMPAAFPLMRVDYVWIAGGLETVQSFVSSKKSSDHRALIVDVRPVGRS